MPNSNLIFSSSSRRLSAPLVLNKHVKGMQVRFSLESEDDAVLMGVIPFLNEYLQGITFDDLEDAMQRFKGGLNLIKADWQGILNDLDGLPPVRIYCEQEGHILENKNVVLVIESTSDEHVWVTHQIAWMLKMHLEKVLQLSAALLKAREAVRKEVVLSSDRPNTDLAKLFMMEPSSGMTLQELEYLSLAFKAISPYDTTPSAFKVISDHYTSGMKNWNTVSAYSHCLSGISIEEHLGNVLTAAPTTHINFYILEEDEQEFEEALRARYPDILNDRLNSINFIPVGGDKIKRAKFWLNTLEDLVGSEMNSMGYKYLDKQFGVPSIIDSASEIETICKALREDNWCVDGYSFEVTEKIVSDASVKLREDISYKTVEWDDNYIDASKMNLAYENGMVHLYADFDYIISRVIDRMTEKYPHDYKEDEVIFGNHSGQWLKLALYQKEEV
ncbi:hypothetical protein VCR15J2_390135 [Vibrio coralliirubri]|uniref:hypothetical protein n=1 Tax=Vibrio coralliirubri TaxID=1516159 RepID=UPI0006300754|nr:hypothetical protein [Vibrio coralliirubri]CDT54137.1 hypothetical protein VCR15J2_390135 [Vibrio coralliirubri]